MTSSEQSRRAPSFGRALRIVLGVLLIVSVTPLYFRLPLRIVLGALLLMLALFVVYCVIHFMVSRHIAGFGPSLGSILVHALLIALYVAGFSRAPLLGGGKGQLAAVMFLGVSLVIAGIRGIAGCELMAIPDLFLRKDVELGCPIFSPLDQLERKLRSERKN
jgi:hypothetical protein